MSLTTNEGNKCNKMRHIFVYECFYGLVPDGHEIDHIDNNKNNNKLNMLNNKMLYTGGIGLDIISIYDVVLRVEYSFNQLNQSGLFVRKADSRN